MSELYLSKILPPRVLAAIHGYLYSPITQKYIRNQMQMMNHRLNSAARWELLIRDSKDIKIQLPMHELNGFNFAQFIQQSIQTRNIVNVLPQFRKFCLQTISNNPSVMFNRYYVGNGGFPVCEMIASFLTRNQINGTYYWSVPGLEQVLFDILVHAREVGCFDSFDKTWKLMYALQLSYFVTAWTVGTIDLVLSTFWYSLQQAIKNERQFQESEGLQGSFYYQSSIQRFFCSMFSLYAENQRNDSYRWLYVVRSKQQLIHTQMPKIKKTIHAILQLLDNKYSEFIYKFRDKVSYALRKVNSMQLIVELIHCYSSFRKIIFGQQFVFFAFKSRNMVMCQLLWSFEEQRKNICNMKNAKGLNLLQSISKSYGLTHNIIKILWSSGQFQTMPAIKNKKSQKLIKQWLQQKI